MRTLLPVLALACTTRPPAAPTRSDPPAAATEQQAGARAPLTVHWILGSATDAEIDLVARIEFAAPLRELNLSVTVPAGLRLLEGPLSTSVSAPDDLSPVEIAYRFAVEEPGVGDLVVEVDRQTATAGVHAKDIYRRGAGTPKASQAPVDDRPNLEVGHRNFGPSTPIQ